MYAIRSYYVFLRLLDGNGQVALLGQFVQPLFQAVERVPVAGVITSYSIHYTKLYDFVGLDPISMGVIVRLVRRMNDALGITSIIVSHDVQEISTVADRNNFV